ncbi:hypothetical protein V494_03760 [Pseudogymnoascus sp. VKM F-4513 (FW-928)]|nr:hypothetical protein V494_03760 [Pseudogymnoascus sp. VKM F-4513 (FW-928)]
MRGSLRCLDYNAVPYAASLDFASLGTNGGHNGSAGYDFLLYRPEVVNDFGYQSIYVEASTRGRQGIKEVTMYPNDFDGILAGSASVHWFTIVSDYALLARLSRWPDISSTSYVH